MLQWMGGSRRKVTTSRKSTHKRQKQYFEQRKRQQHQTAGSESYADGKRSCPSHYENRSLDILSLANVATVVQDHKTRNLDARDNSGKDDFPLKNQDTHHLSAILINEGAPGNQSEITEERTSLNYAIEAEHSKTVPVHIPDHGVASVGKGNRLDSFKLSSAHCLGEVETETPVHSPKIPHRSFLNGYSPQIKEKRHTIRSKLLDYDFDDLGSPMVVFSPNKCPIDQPFSPGDVMDIFDHSDPKFLNFRKSSPFNWSSDAMRGDFINDEHIYNIQEKGRNFWDGPNFLDDSIDDLGGGNDSFLDNRIDPRKAGYDDCYSNKDPWELDIFSGWNVKKKWSSAKTTNTFDRRGPPVTNPKPHIIEDLPDAIISDTGW